MPRTRAQSKLEEHFEAPEQDAKAGEKRDAPAEDSAKPEVAEAKDESAEEPPTKKQKIEEEGADAQEDMKAKPEEQASYDFQSGTIERGHIYFFYRPKVEHDEAHNIDDVQRFQLVLVPRPPAFAQDTNPQQSDTKPEAADDDVDMAVLQPGADAVPAAEPTGRDKKRFRVIAVGKKELPDPASGGQGRGRKQTFWAAVTTVGEDLGKLGEGLGPSTYKTKTRGTRHQAGSRLAGRGAYAIVNDDPGVPSKRATHLGYVLSHPSEPSDVQRALGIQKAASFALQLRNPLAPATGAGGAAVGLGRGSKAEYPERVMREVFGQGEKGTSKSTGLRFASIPTAGLLDYEGAELLFIASHGGEEGVEQSLGEGWGEALQELEEKESKEPQEQVFKELALDLEKFPAEPLEGEWILAKGKINET